MTGEDRHPVDVLAEQYAEQLRRGERPNIDDYVGRYPEHADAIRNVFPSVEMVERLCDLGGPGQIRAGGSTIPSGTSRDRRPPPAAPQSMPANLGDFLLVREIGRGGMGVVYEAIQQSLKRRVALKVIGPAGAASPRHRQRFRREAEAVAALHHTNIAAVFGTGEDQGWHYFAMQLIDGATFADIVDGLRARTDSARGAEEPADDRDDTGNHLHDPPRASDDPPRASDQHDPRRVAEMGREIAAALAHAHRQGVLHRDIKPSNLMLDSDGRVWLTDFGLAAGETVDRVTQTGEIVGTLRYMAPEQLRGQFDARTDVYCLGVTLYEMLTLSPARPGTAQELLDVTRAAAIVPPKTLRPNIAADLETIVMKACAWEPAHRYATADDLEDDLRRFLEDRPIRARRVTPPERLWRWSRRNPMVATLTASTVMLLATLAGVLGWMNHQKRQSLEEIAFQFGRAETSLREKTAALAEAERSRDEADRERRRAETNLTLAVEAFEAIVDNVAARSGADVLLENLDGELLTLAGGDALLTTADVELLEGLLDFFDQFSTANATDLRVQTAAAEKRVGDIQQQLGRYEEAERAYAESRGTYEALAQVQPEDTLLRVRQLEIIHEQIELAARDGRLAEARRHFADAKSIVAKSPQLERSPEGRFTLARILTLFGSVDSRLAAGAEIGSLKPWLTRLIGLRAAAARNQPPAARRSPLHRGRRRSERSEREGPMARPDGAAEAHDRSIELLESLLADEPDNAAYALALARARAAAAKTARLGRNAGRARRQRELAIEAFEALNREYPEAAAFRFELADLLAAGATSNAEGRRDLLRAARLCRDLVNDHPDQLAYQSLDAAVRTRIAALQLVGGHPRRAEATLQDVIETQKAIVASQPDVMLHQMMLAQSYRNLAEFELRWGETERARDHFDRAIALVEKMANRSRARPALSRHLERLREHRP